jgi:hypothetical protein
MYKKLDKINKDTRALGPFVPYSALSPLSDFYKQEEDINPRSLYKKGHQFCPPNDKPKTHNRLRRHGRKINSTSLVFNAHDHSGPFLTKSDEVLPLSEIMEIERAYRRNPSSLPPEIRSQIERSKNARSPCLGAPYSRQSFNEKCFDRILCETSASRRMGLSLKEVYALKGKTILANLVYDRDGRIVHLRQMKLQPNTIEGFLDDIKVDSSNSDYLTILSLFTSQMRYDSIRQDNPGYRPKLKTIIEDIGYHPNGKF